MADSYVLGSASSISPSDGSVTVEANDIDVNIDDENIEKLKIWANGLIVKENLDSDQQQFLNEKCFRRYLVARRGNIESAKENILSSLKWRLQHVQKPYSCPLCEQLPSAHCFMPIGWDGNGNSIIYCCPAKVADNNVEGTVHHVVHSLELCFENSLHSDQWIWVMDFKGYGLWHAMQVRLGIAFLTTFNYHMPERVYKILLINPPTVFDLLLTACRPFMDQRQLNKISSVHGTIDEVLAVFRSDHNIVDEEVLSWLKGTCEMDAVPGNVLPIPPQALCIQFPRAINTTNFTVTNLSASDTDTTDITATAVTTSISVSANSNTVN